MQHLLITLLILLSLTACEDKEQQAKDQAIHDAQVAQQARAELLAQIAAEKEAQKKENTKLNMIGISMNNDTITIDTNKTKDFLNDLNQKMHDQIQKMSDDMEKGIIESKEAGIDINEKHIHIDLNKTQNLLQNWGKRLQVFKEEFDSVTKSLDTNNTNTTKKGM